MIAGFLPRIFKPLSGGRVSQDLEMAVLARSKEKETAGGIGASRNRKPRAARYAVDACHLAVVGAEYGDDAALVEIFACCSRWDMFVFDEEVARTDRGHLDRCQSLFRGLKPVLTRNIAGRRYDIQMRANMSLKDVNVTVLGAELECVARE